MTLPGSSKHTEFYLKREDLSSTVYGGNKVRTLEFQLPCAYAALEREGNNGRIVSFGGAGSNQCVALTAHATKQYSASTGMIGNNSFSWSGITLLVLIPEPGNKDNGLNLISMFSFKKGYAIHKSQLTPRIPFCLWTESAVSKLVQVLKAVWLSNDKILMPGGANVTGALGISK